MPNKFIIPAPPAVGGTTPSGTALINLVTGGPRYHAVWLRDTVTFQATPTLSSVFGLIKVKVNGRTQWELTAQQLNALNLLMGESFACYVALQSNPNAIVAAFDENGDCKTVTDGVITATAYSSTAVHVVHLPLFFAEPWRKQYAAEDMMAWPTRWNGPGAVATLQVEVTLGAFLSPNLDCDVEIDYEPGLSDKNGQPIFLIRKIGTHTVTGFSGTADNIVTNLPRTDMYQSLHAFSGHATEQIAQVKVKVENNLIRDCSKGELDLINSSRDMNAKAITTGRTDIVFDYTDAPDGGLPMTYGGRQVQDFQVILARSASTVTTATLISQRFGPPD